MSGPVAGPTTVHPRPRSVVRFATVAGWDHISVCIAGATTSGPSCTSTVVVSRSSASPFASFASVWAVAG
jgi:hypothetical protein